MRAVISSFGGIVPRLSDHSLKSLNAIIADSVKLRNGRLESWRSMCPFDTPVPVSDAKSFHLYGCCPVLWQEPAVQAADVHPDWGRFYITGRTNRLEAVEVDRCTCQPSYYYVGVPAPTAPPVASASEECSRIADSRAYVYTYVNKWYEESAPSPASNIVRVNDGSRVRVTGIAMPPDGYGIIGANLYRASTGYQNADGKTQKPLTDFLYVGFVEFPSTTFDDTIKMVGLGPVLETEKVRVPPVGLSNVCKIDGVTRLAGTTKNNVHLSENFQLHNWPVKYDLTLKSNIVHMGCLDQKLYVTTDTNPYVIDVSNCEDMKCTPVLDVAAPLPDISCVSACSAIITPFGFVYSSSIGVILIDPQARWHVLTSKWFSEDDWQRIQPQTARFAYWEGYLFITTDAVALLLDINGDPYGDMRDAELTTLDNYFEFIHPISYEVSGTGDCFILRDGSVFVWNKGDSYVPFQWRSRALTGDNDAAGPGQVPDNTPALGNTWSPVSAKIKSSLVEFSLRTRQHELYRRVVAGERPIRLPRMGRHQEFFVELRGVEPVDFVNLGTSNFTVNSGT